MEDLSSNIIQESTSTIISYVGLSAMALTVIIISVTLFLLIRQYFFRKRAAKHLRKNQKYNDLLIDCLLSDDKEVSTICRLKGKSEKKYLFDSVIFLMHNFSGEFSDKIKDLFYNLGLEKYIIKKLKSKKWWIVAQGLRDARTMEFHEAVPYAEKYIDDTHLELRVEAQISVMALKTRDPFEFLSQLHRPFSLWARIHLYQEIAKWEQKPDAAEWLKVDNPGVVSFALRVMGNLKQATNNREISQLITDPLAAIRSEAVYYFALTNNRELWLKSAMKYKAEEPEVRQRIGQTANMLSDIPLSMLIQWFNWEKSTPVKIELAKAMRNHDHSKDLQNIELAALETVA
ncbi:hypothetical protein [Marinilabilia rubra]|uniref:HEAT repeat domain-containing protein n=1 Tax=Marinilabilia rubra TaxID=2162893 RepID=A0A2U2BD14_9BACT|nr:hypothetical protein [Marinilabilia rubra]PWE00965.1 hypothetical protein DDZ16_00285 [Marinilabilia rubra]